MISDYIDGVSIILLSYKGSEDTIECVESLMQLKNKAFNIIIVDNCSPDDTFDKLKNSFESNYKNDFGYLSHCDKTREYSNQVNKKIVLISNDKNTGFSAGNNVGIRYSRKYIHNRYIWILNNDTIVDNNNIDCLISDMKKYNDRAMIGSTIVEYYDRAKVQIICGNRFYGWLATKKTFYKGYSINNIDEIKPKFDYIAGCSVFTTDGVLKEIDDMSEEYFLYYEDVDLSMKAKKKNIGLYWCKDSIVYHKHGASIGGANIKRKKSEFSEYHADYNALVYNKKWFGNMAFIPSFNRFIIKKIVFILKHDKELSRVLSKAYKDFKKNKVER